MLRAIRDRGLIGAAVASVIGVAMLIGLGSWQLSRKAWKEELLAKIDARIGAHPIRLAAALETLASGGDAEYLRVVARGTFRHDLERYLYAPDSRLGPGYDVLTPLMLPAGRVVFVNRGFVPETLKDPASRASGQVAGEVEVRGLARAQGTAGYFTPANDPARNLWFWRDLGALHRSAFPAGDRALVPLLIDAEAEPKNPGGWPKGGTTIVSLPNRHLEYALTWFGLAATLLVVFVVYAAARPRS